MHTCATVLRNHSCFNLPHLSRIIQISSVGFLLGSFLITPVYGDTLEGSGEQGAIPRDVVLMDSADVETVQPSSGGGRGFMESRSLSGWLLGEDNAWDSTYRQVQAWKEEYHIPIEVGAQNWFHANTGGPASTGYGVPGLRGTYYWFVNVDPSLKLDSEMVHEVGVHAQIRFRESDDKFRAFFNDTIWTYEAYAYVDTDFGVFKGGQVWRRFGLDWDNTWWGNPQYFDGFKLNPDYGGSWEQTWTVDENFSIDTFAQYFLVQDRVSGALVGGNAETIRALDQEHTGVVRIVPTWQLGEASSLAVGFSGQYIGNIDGAEQFGIDSNQGAWAVDANYFLGNLNIFAEVMQSYGAAVPARYTSGGPSDRTTSVLAGVQYRTGPILWRANASAGWDENPGGRQLIVNPGATISVTENIDFYAEYVYWEVENAQDVVSEFEHGVQLVFVWKY